MKRFVYYLICVILLPLCSYAADLPDYKAGEIWNDSNNIYAAEFYNGKQYVVQLHLNKKGWEMRLIELIVNNDATLSDSRYWVLDNGKNKDPDEFKYNAALEVFNNKLYIYIYCNSENYFFDFETPVNGDATLTKLAVPEPLHHNGLYAYSMTTYRNALLILCNSDDRIPIKGDSGHSLSKMDVVFTRDNPSDSKATWSHLKTDVDFYNCYNCSFNNNIFDVTNWIGVREVDVDGHKVKMQTEELIFGQHVSIWGHFRVIHFNGEPEELGESKDSGHWSEFIETEAVDNHGGRVDPIGIKLKMVEGQIVNVGVANDPNNINNPIQFILSVKLDFTTGNVQRQIICYEYNPEHYAFHTNSHKEIYNFATDLPFGIFGACSVSIPISGTFREKVDEDGNFIEIDNDTGKADLEVEKYQRYISIFRSAALSTHFNHHTNYALIKSNQVKAKSVPINTDTILNSPEGRKLCTLVGVIEGAPPTLADNDEMYNLCGGMGYLSSITIGTSGSDKISATNSTKWGHTNVAGFDGYGAKLSGFSIMGGGGYEVTKSTTNEDTYNWSVSKSIVIRDAVSAKLGRYYYMVPQITEYVGQVYSPDGKRHMSGCGDILTYVQKAVIENLHMYELDSKDIDPMLRVENPLKLESWYERGRRLKASFGKIDGHLITMSANWNDGGIAKFGRTHTVKSSTTKTSSWDTEIKSHFFQHKSGGNVTWTSQTETTVGEDVSIEQKGFYYSFLDKQERDRIAYQYQVAAHIMNNPDDPITKLYYDDLIRRGMMHESETPFIIFWDVPDINYSNFNRLESSSVEEIDEINGFEAVGSKGFVNVNSRSHQKIMIFNISGTQVFSGVCDKGFNQIDLPNGMYIVTNGVETTKIMVK